MEDRILLIGTLSFHNKSFWLQLFIMILDFLGLVGCFRKYLEYLWWIIAILKRFISSNLWFICARGVAEMWKFKVINEKQFYPSITYIEMIKSVRDSWSQILFWLKFITHYLEWIIYCIYIAAILTFTVRCTKFINL